MRGIFKGMGLLCLTLGICAALLLGVCALIPQEAIQQSCEESEVFFSGLGNGPLLIAGSENTRADNYADIALFDVIYHVDASRPLYSMITAPFYRNEGSDIRADFRLSVREGEPANSEYSRYWHGSQVLLRPLLTFTSIHGCRAVLFGLLLAMNAVLAVMLVRRRAVRPLVIYLAGLVLVQFWMGLFTLEYIMSFLVMTGACIAVAAWDKDQTGERLEKRMTAICIVSGTAVCFVDFLTTETLAFTVPVLLWLMLYKESGREKLTLKKLLLLLIRWGAAWLCAYAMTFAVKWLLVYLSMGADALMRVFSSAAYRIDRPMAELESAVTVREVLLPTMLAHNLRMLLPLADKLGTGAVLGLTGGVLALLGAVWYLFRASKPDGAFLAGLLLLGLVPYARLLALPSHALDHAFFTYRAQMAAIMAVCAVMAYSLKPSEVLGKKRRKAKR